MDDRHIALPYEFFHPSIPNPAVSMLEIVDPKGDQGVGDIIIIKACA